MLCAWECRIDLEVGRIDTQAALRYFRINTTDADGTFTSVTFLKQVLVNNTALFPNRESMLEAYEKIMENPSEWATEVSGSFRNCGPFAHCLKGGRATSRT